MSIEIIVVCDADDSCFAVASTYSSQGVIACNLVRHRGSYVAQNTGVSISSGDYITFCGADDFMAPGRIRRMFSLMRRHGPMSLVNSLFCFVDSEGLKIEDRGGWSAETGSILGGVFMYSRAMFERLGGFRDWVCSADTEFMHRAKIAGAKFRVVQSKDYLYRKHGSQLTMNAETGSKSLLRLKYMESISSMIEAEHVEPQVEEFILKV